MASETEGEATILGVPYQQLKDPLKKVGTVLDSRGFHGGLTGVQNLKVISAAAGIDDSRIDEVLEQVELTDAKNKRLKNYSLGMKQRLSLAGALLGNPQILILDEPSNGLDPLGISWLRSFLRGLANEGRAVLISSHQLAEMQNTIDDVLIIHKGRLVASGSLEEVIAEDTLEQAFLKITGGNQ